MPVERHKFSQIALALIYEPSRDMPAEGIEPALMHVLDCVKTELKRRELVNKLHRGRFRLWQESRRFAQTSCPKVSERLVWHSKLDQLPRTFPLGYLLRQCPLRTVTADGPLNCDTASGPARLVSTLFRCGLQTAYDVLHLGERSM